MTGEEQVSSYRHLIVAGKLWQTNWGSDATPAEPLSRPVAAGAALRPIGLALHDGFGVATHPEGGAPPTCFRRAPGHAGIERVMLLHVC